MTREELLLYLTKYNFKIDIDLATKLEILLNETLNANEQFNLTAIKDAESFREKMIFDSALAFHNLDLNDKEILDFGTGAGFPGIVVKLLFPNAKLTLLDATKKKCDHLINLCKRLDIDVNVICSRGEEFAKNNVERFDIVTARAVSSLDVLIELTSKMIKMNGLLISLKGSKGLDEVDEANNACKKCGLKLHHIFEDKLPILGDERVIVFYKKMNSTPNKYPRPYDQILKNHL